MWREQYQTFHTKFSDQLESKKNEAAQRVRNEYPALLVVYHVCRRQSSWRNDAWIQEVEYETILATEKSRRWNQGQHHYDTVCTMTTCWEIDVELENGDNSVAWQPFEDDGTEWLIEVVNDEEGR